MRMTSHSPSSSSSSSAEQRRHVLRAVQQQAQLCAAVAAGLAPSSGTDPLQQPHWEPGQWFAAFQFLFYEDDHANACHDDLIFFVKQSAAPYTPCSSFMVHRKSKAVPADLSISGKAFPSVAWPETVLLNLVLQAHYQLTVTACRQELLTRVAHGVDVGHEVVEVTRPVYASPTQMAVNLSTSKVEAEPKPTYPEIFFAVDNYDDIFTDVVLRQGDDCFCVVLKAVLPGLPSAAVPTLPPATTPVPTPAPAPDESSVSAGEGVQSPLPAKLEPRSVTVGDGATAATEGSPLAEATGKSRPAPQQQEPPRELMLFSGYVVHQQIHEHLSSKLTASSSSRLLPALADMLERMFGSSSKGGKDRQSGAAPQQQQRHSVHMRGPGGVGCAEVAVAAFQPPLCDDDVAPAEARGRTGAQSPPLHCALLSVSMPVQVLAEALLDA